MKPRSKSIVGTITANGLLKVDPAELASFTKEWPKMRVSLTIEVIPEETSAYLVAYYLRAIVPEFQEAFRSIDGERISLQETDIKLRKMSSVMIEEIPNEETGEFDLHRVVRIAEAGNHRAAEFIEDLKVIGATRYGIAIKEPRK